MDRSDPWSRAGVKAWGGALCSATSSRTRHQFFDRGGFVLMTKDAEVLWYRSMQHPSNLEQLLAYPGTRVPVRHPGGRPNGTSANGVGNPHNPPKKSRLNCNVGCKVIKLSAHINICRHAQHAQPDDEAIRSRLSPVNMFRVLAAPVNGWMGR